MTRLSPVLVALLGALGSAGAHVVPVPPSNCAFDPVVIEAPSAQLIATASPAQPTDQFRMLYDPQASQAQFDLRGVAPRPFSAPGVTGTLALPSFFVASLFSTGDLTATPSLAFTVNGSTATVQVPLTTGLAAAGTTIVEGSPLERISGRYTLVGATSDPAVSALLASPLAVQLTCQALPVPDTDQFRLGTRTSPVSARLTARALRLRLIFSPGPTDQPAFPDRPVLLRASIGGVTVATVSLPALPQQRRKLFLGRSDDGRAALGVRALPRTAALAFLLATKVKEPVLPPAGTAVTVDLSVTYDVGGLLSRTTFPLRVKRRGALLRYP